MESMNASTRHVLDRREKAAIALVFCIALVAPYGTFMYSVGDYDHGYLVHVSIFAILWCIVPLGFGTPQLLVLDPFWMLLSAIFGIFNILFAVQFARYYKLLASRTSTILLGFLTLLLPTVFAALAAAGFADFPMAVVSPYMGPIPIQLAVAFLLMHFQKRSRITMPWQDSESP